MDWLYFTLIGIVCGFLARDRSTKILGNLYVGIMGAIPAGLLFRWSDLFPYSHFVGACVGAFFFVGLKRAFTADSS